MYSRKILTLEPVRIFSANAGTLKEEEDEAPFHKIIPEERKRKLSAFAQEQFTRAGAYTCIFFSLLYNKRGEEPSTSNKNTKKKKKEENQAKITTAAPSYWNLALLNFYP